MCRLFIPASKTVAQAALSDAWLVFMQVSRRCSSEYAAERSDIASDEQAAFSASVM